MRSRVSHVGHRLVLVVWHFADVGKDLMVPAGASASTGLVLERVACLRQKPVLSVEVALLQVKSPEVVFVEGAWYCPRSVAKSGSACLMLMTTACPSLPCSPKTAMVGKSGAETSCGDDRRPC